MSKKRVQDCDLSPQTASLSRWLSSIVHENSSALFLFLRILVSIAPLSRASVESLSSPAHEQVAVSVTVGYSHIALDDSVGFDSCKTFESSPMFSMEWKPTHWTKLNCTEPCSKCSHSSVIMIPRDLDGIFLFSECLRKKAKQLQSRVAARFKTNI